jgi:hypothetical protein
MTINNPTAKGTVVASNGGLFEGQNGGVCSVAALARLGLLPQQPTFAKHVCSRA